MTHYILLQVILLSLVLYSFKQNLAKKVAILYASIFLLTMSALRYGVGVDFFSYERYYLKVIDGDFLNVEYGFIFLSNICNYLGLGFQGVVASYAVLTNILFISFYSRYSKNILLSIYVFTMLPLLYLSSFNVIRQFLVVAIFAFSIRYIIERKLILYIIYLVLAAVFVHKSIIIMLPMYFLLTRNLNWRNCIVVSVMYIISLQLMGFIVSELGFSAVYLNGNFKNTGINYLVFIYFIIFVFIFYLRNKLISNKPENIVFINMAFICTLVSFSPMLSDLPSAPFLRLSSFFTIAIPIIMVNVLPVIKNYKIRIFYFLGVIFAPTLYFYVTLLLKGEVYKLTPYNTFILN